MILSFFICRVWIQAIIRVWPQTFLYIIQAVLILKCNFLPSIHVITHQKVQLKWSDTAADAMDTIPVKNNNYLTPTTALVCSIQPQNSATLVLWIEHVPSDNNEHDHSLTVNIPHGALKKWISHIRKQRICPI